MTARTIGTPRSHPAFSALQPWLGEDVGALTIDRLNTLVTTSHADRPVTDRGASIRFVPSGTRLSALDYEMRILTTGSVPVRRGSIHDVFNALAWIAFPRAKQACNALHAAHAGTRSSRRGPVRDAITLFDESGMIALAGDPAIGERLARRQWKSVFWDRRADVAQALAFFVCGHALLEKMLSPYPAITGRVLIVDVEPDVLRAPPPELRAIADALAAPRIRSLTHPGMIPPLPLAAIPGWHEANTNPAFYDDRSIFRVSATMAAGSASTDSASAVAPALSSSSAVP